MRLQMVQIILVIFLWPGIHEAALLLNKSPWICCYGFLSSATLQFGRPLFLPRIVEDDPTLAVARVVLGLNLKKCHSKHWELTLCWARWRNWSSKRLGNSSARKWQSQDLNPGGLTPKLVILSSIADNGSGNKKKPASLNWPQEKALKEHGISWPDIFCPHVHWTAQLRVGPLAEDCTSG